VWALELVATGGIAITAFLSLSLNVIPPTPPGVELAIFDFNNT
jgi:hypothetical protein